MRRTLAIAMLLVGCTPEPGDSCMPETGYCRSAHEALWCFDGALAVVRCDGANGCRANALTVRCDQSIAALDERCVSEGAACSRDHSQYLRCEDGVQRMHANCRGADHCHLDGSMVRCDESIGVVGETCDAEGAACAEDGLQLLECRGGAFAVRHPTETCTVENGRNVRWTGPYGTLGEQCLGEGGVCTTDGQLLRCDNGAFAPHLVCRGARGCYADGTLRRCDQSIAAAGDVCTGSGASCSEDGSIRLDCVDGAFVEKYRCPGGCAVEQARVQCTGAVAIPE